MSVRALCTTLPNPERVYRSGLRERPSALRGHTFSMVDPPDGWAEDPESYPETPDLWQCMFCYVIHAGWQITERWLEPCTGRVRMLLAGPPPPGPGLAWGEVQVWVHHDLERGPDGRLFPVPEVEHDTDHPLHSATMRRTARARAAIANGNHPLGGPLMIGTGETCGTCDHAENVGHGNRRYWKCLLAGITRGPGTDLRLSWPACSQWEPKP